MSYLLSGLRYVLTGVIALLLILLLVIALAGCTLGPNYVNPSVSVSANYKEQLDSPCPKLLWARANLSADQNPIATFMLATWMWTAVRRTRGTRHNLALTAPVGAAREIITSRSSALDKLRKILKTPNEYGNSAGIFCLSY